MICHGDLHPFNILTHPHGDTVLLAGDEVLAIVRTDVASDLAELLGRSS